jgi:hypothetical protein
MGRIKKPAVIRITTAAPIRRDGVYFFMGFLFVSDKFK